MHGLRLVSLLGAFFFITSSASAAYAAQNICGWVMNPTPGNWSIVDSRDEWTIGTQGGEPANGVDIPDFGKAWVVTNSGGHGYGCACIQASVNDAEKSITTLHRFKVQPLRKCKADKALPHPQ